jgi:chromate transport protein ChrA
MGPVETQLRTTGGKLFAGFYALYAGMVVLVAASILVAPLMHRYMHKFHLESRERQD